MKWIKFTLETTTEATDLLSYELSRIGIEGIEIEDRLPAGNEERALELGEILPVREADDGTATIHFYLEPPCDIEKRLKQVNDIFREASDYTDIGKGTVHAAETPDIDWVSNWKQYFKPFRATENIIIKPTWESAEKESDTDIIIEIDPDTAFGTGSHETTLLCLQALEKYQKQKMRILDVGCGSGILTVVACKLGAGSATAVDIDETAVKIAGKNLAVNHISNAKLLTGNLIDNEKLREQIGFGCFDMVLANILADILIPLSSVIRPHMKKDGLFVTSGIINTKADEVRQALLRNHFEIIDTLTMKEWVSFIVK